MKKNIQTLRSGIAVALFIIFGILNSQTIHAQTIDLSKPVGSTSGSGVQNGMGGINYTIPIQSTPGIGGLQPDVNLVYSSQAGAGAFGWGWNLSVLSSITRSGRRNYYNGVNTPVDWTNTNDAFVLDGQRLFLTSGTYGANGATYGTENENFSKVESIGGSGVTGPAYFKVTLKNGTVLEYGNASDALMTTDNSTASNMIWLLNKITDINGNYELFSYYLNNSGRNFALKKIEYTGNSAKGILPQDKIEFAYINKSNWQAQKTFQSGASLYDQFLLNTITVTHNTNTVRTYTSAYSRLHNQYFLQSFTETGADNTSYNPLTFSYGSNLTAPDVTVSIAYPDFLNYNNVYSGDITGDGKQDLVGVYYTIDNNGWQHDKSYTVFDGFSQYGSSPAISIAYNYTINYGARPDKATQIRRLSDHLNFLTSDYDGDNKQDVLMTNWKLSGTEMLFEGIDINYSRFYSSVSGSTYKNVQYASLPHVTAYTQDFVYSYHGGTNFIPGDFDGDGAQDYILILGINGTNAFKAFFSSPKKNIFNKEILTFGVEGSPSDPFYATSVASATGVVPIDFDGDGKTEILVQKASQSYVLSVFPTIVTPGYSYAANILYTTSDIKAGYRVFPGDFNGDGNTDLLVRSSEHNVAAPWNILYSTGKNFVSYPFTFQKGVYLDGDYTGDVHHLMVADLNGDGKSDIWHSLDDLATGTLQSLHTIYYSDGVPQGGQSQAFYAETYTRPESINRNTTTQTVYVDANGDSKPDILSLNASNNRFIYPKPFKEDRFMAKSTDGLGNQTTYNYEILSNSSALYQRSALYEYDNPNEQPGQQTNGNPYMVVKSPIYALSSINLPNGIGGVSTVSYSYKDAVASAIRGFLGYKQVIESNWSNGFIQTSISDIDPSILLPHLVEKNTVYGSTTVSSLKITDALTRVNPGNNADKRYVYHVNQTNQYDGLTGTAIQNTNTYDNYNNITVGVESKGYMNGSIFTATETTTTTTVFGAHGTPVPASPESVTVSSTRSGQTAVSKTTAYTYDSKGNIATSVDFSGTALATTTTNTYDGFGNITQTVVSAPSTLTPTLSYTYDNTGRFLMKKQAAGSGITKTETFTYDPVFGLRATAVSSDGLTTGYTYDAFGRLNRTTLPDGNAITETIGWETSTGRYSTVSQRVADGGKYQKIYFDVLGRKVKTETGGFNNQMLASTINYNSKGQVSSQTDPHYSSETVITNTNNYDNYGRLSSSGNGTSSISLSYAMLSGGQYKMTVTNAAGQATSKTRDGAGRIIYANDNGGQLSYTYDSWGNQKTVQLGSNTLVSSVYDAYGRQTSLTDINSGTVGYEYNALGKMTKQTDALGHVTTFTYDAFSRVLTRTGAEGTTSYIYYNDTGTGKCNDNLSKVTGFSGDVTTYGYDNLSRKISESVVYDGNTFATTLSYDSYGNPVKITYPSGVVINDTYDKNGALIKTTMGSGTETVLFTATAINSKGLYTGYTYGNGKNSIVSYDFVKGVPTRYYTAGIQDLNMSFDGQNGNLLSRNDAIKSLTETFTYDNLNRLTGSTVNSVQQFTMTYDNTGGTSLGNIKSKSDIGNYVYDNNQINAVKYITSTAGGYTSPGVISHNTEYLAYTVFSKVSGISENGYALNYAYGQDYQRIKYTMKQSGTLIETRYYLGSFERQVKSGVTRDIHYIKAGNGLSVIIVKQGSTITPYFVYTDHLGSLLTLTDISGNIVAEQNFDAWGRNRNPGNWTYASVPTVPDWLYRGYTGHEQLPQFVLINMNGRIYDPVIGRMIGPDIYITYPWSSQGYNRYGYGLNNPLIYFDPTGNSVWSFLANYILTIPKRVWNGVKIIAGVFAFNPHLTVVQNLLGIASRLTWELPQEVVGLGAALLNNALGGVEDVKYFDGATVLTTNWLKKQNSPGGGRAFTIGRFITGPSDMKVDPNDAIFQHEYGRYLQSRAQGLAYLTFTAIPDLLASGNDNPTAWDGNARALKYFDRYYGGVYTSSATRGTNSVYFDVSNNFIHGYDPTLPPNNPINQAALKNNTRQPGAFDIIKGALLPLLAIGLGWF